MKNIFIFLCVFVASVLNAQEFKSNWKCSSQRNWIGPEYWSNRLEDWQLNNNRLECINGDKPLRTLHILTHEISSRPSDATIRVKVGRISDQSKLDETAMVGFLFGAGGNGQNYKARSLVHEVSGPGGGIVAVLNGLGQLAFYDNEKNFQLINPSIKSNQSIKVSATSEIELRIDIIANKDLCNIKLSAFDSKNNNTLLGEIQIDNISADRVAGNLALIARQKGQAFWFNDWTISGDRISVHNDRTFGTVMGVMFLQSKGVLKLTAQFPPLGASDPKTASLEISLKGKDKFFSKANANIDNKSWTATFAVPNWETTQDYDFRVVYDLPGLDPKYKYYEGFIPKDPVQKEALVVAAFTGNLNTTGPFAGYKNERTFQFTDKIWFPHTDLDTFVARNKPDLLFYSGDQIYEGMPYLPDKTSGPASYLNYLNKWYLFYWAHGSLTRRIPTIAIPDDHDVFQINLWGANGIKTRAITATLPEHYKNNQHHYAIQGGGYEMSADWVNFVQRTQTSHLPDPFDPSPVEQGIQTYFTDATYGGISFAIFEDRKFKSAPDFVSEAKVVNGNPTVANFDPLMADKAGASLYGERQLKFIKKWAQDWTGAWMKVALSQTILACLQTNTPDYKNDLKLAIPKNTYPTDQIPVMDFDSNGWPQSERNKILKELRKCYTFMIAGDQHLGSLIKHGTDEYEDAGYSFCVPSIANLAARRWLPNTTGTNQLNGSARYTGRYLDGFGNKMNVLAVANPYESGKKPSELMDKAPGYGIVKFFKQTQEIMVECWPRWADPLKDNQFDGWPVVLNMEDNYGTTPQGWLPTLKITGLQIPPVVQVIDELSGELVYTVRARSFQFAPKVFTKNNYTIIVGDPGSANTKTFKGIKPLDKKDKKDLEVKF